MAGPLRIFVSSPGDVTRERQAAVLVVQALAKEYARFFDITAESWDTEPMLASGHFQDNIIPPSKTDIVLLILWSRLGTPLPERTDVREYRGIDGRVPVTGTEWEFENALAAHKANTNGLPDLLVYRKRAPEIKFSTTDDLDKITHQYRMLETFWSRYFVGDGEFRAAFTQFDAPEDFSRRLESDLRKLIERRIQGSTEAPRTWLNEPFRGLSSYAFEQAPIFFGRAEATKSGVERLTQGSEAGRAFLLVLGASGSGKSSLAQAGILPALFERGVIPGAGLWRRAIMRPSGDAQGPFAALARALISETALPELLESGQDASALARHLETAADDPMFPIVTALHQIERFAQQQGRLLLFERASLALVVDQLEELYTAGQTTTSQREAFMRCLDALARSGIFVIATMRNDYWHRAAETPLLVDMADGLRQLNLLAPSASEIGEMVRRPARAAGITFGLNPRTDITFDADLADEAAHEPGSLPLLSFLLESLYAKDIRWPDHSTLTYESLISLGGLKGAIAKRAEGLFVRLPGEVRAALPNVLHALVAIGRQGQVSAKSAPLSRFPEGSSARSLIDVFSAPDARLLILSSDDARATPQVRVAHEALLSNWAEAKKCIETDRNDLVLEGRLAEDAVLWKAAGGTDRASRLLPPGLPLDEAVDLLARRAEALDPDVKAFVQASKDDAERKKRTRTLQRTGTVAGAVLLLVALAILMGGGRWGLDQIKKNNAEHIARESNIYGAVNAAALDATAYSDFASPLTTSALLSGLERFSGTRNANVPQWRRGAFSGGGNYLALLTGSPDRASLSRESSLIVLKTLDLTFWTQVTNVQARYICGFSWVPTAAEASKVTDEKRPVWFAYADDKKVTVIDVLDRTHGSALVGSLSLPGVTAIGCLAQSERVAIAYTGGKVLMFDPKTGKSTAISRPSIEPIVGITTSKFVPSDQVTSPSSSQDAMALIREDGSVEVFLGERYLGVIRNARKTTSDCVVVDCAANVSFDPVHERIAWQGEGAMLVSSLATIRNGTNVAERHPCDVCGGEENVVAAFPYPKKPEFSYPPDIITTRRVEKVYINEYATLYHLDYDPNSPLPLYNRELNIFASWAKNGVALHSLTDLNTPLIVGINVPFGSADSSLVAPHWFMRIVTNASVPQAFDLEHLREAIFRINTSPSIQLYDAGGGTDLASFDFTRCEVRLYSESATTGGASPTFAEAQVLRPVSCPVRNATSDSVQVAFDHASGTITILSMNGAETPHVQITVWKNGRLLNRQSGDVWHGAPQLSSRGNYVTFVDDRASTQVLLARTMDAASGKVTWQPVTLDGSGVWISGDERYLFATQKDADDLDTSIHAYELPLGTGLHLIPFPELDVGGGTGPVALSSDGRRLAYVVSGADGARRIQLLDVEARELVGPPLPEIPSLEEIRGLRFSPDGLFVMALIRQQAREQTRDWLFLYATSPQQWMQQLCLIAGAEGAATPACRALSGEIVPLGPRSL